MICFYYNKQLLSALGLVLYGFDANKKCQVSLVVKYINVHILFLFEGVSQCQCMEQEASFDYDTP